MSVARSNVFAGLPSSEGPAPGLDPSPTSPLADGVVVLTNGTWYRAAGQHTRDEIAASQVLDEVLGRVLAILGPSGGSITFGPGTFVAHEPIRLCDNLRVAGAGPATRLTCDAAGGCEAVILAEDATNVHVANLTVTAGETRSARSGIVVASCVSSQIREVMAIGFAEHGIRLCDNSALCQIASCTAAGNGLANICLDHLHRGPYGHFVPNLVTGCTIYGGGTGVECRRAIVTNITGCIVHQTHGPAYLLHERSNSICITGSRSFQIGSDAVRVEESDEFTLTGNIFCWHTGHGVVITEARWGTICGNEVIDSGSYNPGGPDLTTRFEQLDPPPTLHDGIRLIDVAGYSVTGNTIFNWGVAPRLAAGIREDETSHDNVITGNNINYYTHNPTQTHGARTTALNNIGFADRPHQDRPDSTKVQSFEPEIIEALIQRMT